MAVPASNSESAHTTDNRSATPPSQTEAFNTRTWNQFRRDNLDLTTINGNEVSFSNMNSYKASNTVIGITGKVKSDFTDLTITDAKIPTAVDALFSRSQLNNVTLGDIAGANLKDATLQNVKFNGTIKPEQLIETHIPDRTNVTIGSQSASTQQEFWAQLDKAKEGAQREKEGVSAFSSFSHLLAFVADKLFSAKAASANATSPSTPAQATATPVASKKHNTVASKELTTAVKEGVHLKALGVTSTSDAATSSFVSKTSASSKTQQQVH